MGVIGKKKWDLDNFKKDSVPVIVGDKSNLATVPLREPEETDVKSMCSESATNNKKNSAKANPVNT